MLAEVFTSFPVIVGISFLVVILIYWLGVRMSKARSEKEAESRILYASGEEPPHDAPQINLERFVIYVIYFYIFDILAFLVVTSFEQTGGATIMYASIILTAILFLVPHNWRREEVYE
jgi:NADH:ubiquinone oxidoreductase subunit 3 (subunit A)